MQRVSRSIWRKRRPGGETKTIALSFSTDFAANIFAVLFVMLVIAATRTTPSPTPSGEIKTVASWRERRPFDAGGLVALLHRRQARGPGLILDLMPDGLRIIDSGTARFLPWDDAAGISRELSQQPDRRTRPVALFVFAPRGYALVSRALGPDPVDEMSPPAALRRCLPPQETSFGCRDGDDWSSGFSALGDRPLSNERFGFELAKLLAAEPIQERTNQLDRSQRSPSQASDNGTGRTDAKAAPSTLPRFGRIAGWIFVAIVLFVVETLTSRTVECSKRDTRARRCQ